MIRLLLWLLGGMLLGGDRASRDRAVAAAHWRRRTPIRGWRRSRRSMRSRRCRRRRPRTPPCRSWIRPSPRRSAATTCRDGPLKFSVPVSPAYTSVSFYTRSEVAYYAINDRAAGRRVIELDLMTTRAAQRPAGRRGRHRRRPADRGIADRPPADRDQGARARAGPDAGGARRARGRPLPAAAATSQSTSVCAPRRGCAACAGQEAAPMRVRSSVIARSRLDRRGRRARDHQALERIVVARHALVQSDGRPRRRSRCSRCCAGARCRARPGSRREMGEAFATLAVHVGDARPRSQRTARAG